MAGGRKKPLVPIRAGGVTKAAPAEKRNKPKKKRTLQHRNPPHASTADEPAAGQASTSAHAKASGAWRCGSVVDEQAAVAVERLLRSDNHKSHGATLKSLVLAAHVQNKKATYAVTCETLKHLSVLQDVLNASGLLETHDKLSEAVALVLLQELLFGKGLTRNGPAERAVLSMQEELRGLLKGAQQRKRARGEGADKDVEAAEARPRWARINLLRLQPDELQQRLRAHKDTAHLADTVKFDPLLPDLVSFPPGSALHDHPLVLDGSLVLQSKASCMPAHALAPKPGWEVVDCCAAPGNKTTHVAALLAGNSRVFAFDRDPKRLKRLKANASLTGASNIVAQQADFLEVDPLDPLYAKVKGVILDPSCSGSGTKISRMDYLLPSHKAGDQVAPTEAHEVPEGEQQRVESLAQFQEAAVKHALQFPALQRLVYSTCSLFQRENEDVVAAVLPHARSLGFDLEDPFPSWTRRGLPVLPEAPLLVRTDPYQDSTDGFFVAVFQRQPAGPAAKAQPTAVPATGGDVPTAIKANRSSAKRRRK